MRLDKFLKLSRIIKRRTVAKEASAADKVKVNSRIAKPSTQINVGDIIEINYFQKKLVIKVNSIDTIVRKEEAKEMYEIIEIIETSQ